MSNFVAKGWQHLSPPTFSYSTGIKSAPFQTSASLSPEMIGPHRFESDMIRRPRVHALKVLNRSEPTIPLPNIASIISPRGNTDQCVTRPTEREFLAGRAAIYASASFPADTPIWLISALRASSRMAVISSSFYRFLLFSERLHCLRQQLVAQKKCRGASRQLLNSQIAKTKS